MSNPYLPNHEYIPDGEPRVFGDRVYIYGSHDLPDSDKFCDHKLKVWSASIHDLNNWVCHGHIFHTMPDEDHVSDTDWTTIENELYAPDVVEKDGKYYLYAYIMGTQGCVSVSDRPEGPFTLISKYKFNIPEGSDDSYCNNGWFIDPGVLVDDDGRVYVYCGFERSFVAELNPDNMYEVIDGTYLDDIIPVDAPFRFFEACSPRKIGDTYYLIYSPKRGCYMAYATSDSPMGPFTFRGYIVDNGEDYPGGNDHGSLMKIEDQWYIFYHRMTNHTIMSRRGCVEKVTILPDGTIPQVEMTSLGFENALNPYEIIPADIACVLKKDCFITEKNIFTRTISNIVDGSIFGYKYFDFGEDYSSRTMLFHAKINPLASRAKLHIYADAYPESADCGPENGGDIPSETRSCCNSAPAPLEIGCLEIGEDTRIVSARVTALTGRHALYFVVESAYGGWFTDMFKGRHLFEFEAFTFTK